MTDLFPTWTLGDLELTSYPFAVEFDGDHGAPETISELVTSMLADGDLVRQTRHGNREISIVVQVEGPTLGVLAENEATLRAECMKPSTLTFQPGDVDSPASVFEVLLVEMRQPRNDTHEAHLMRRWELTLTCAPFARSLDPTVVLALEVPGSEASVTVDTCDSATGWTGFLNTTPATPDMAWAAGAVSIHELIIPGGQSLTLVRTGAVDFTSTRYLEAEIGYNSAFGALPITCVADDTRPLQTVAHRSIGSGRFLFTFDTENVPVSKLAFTSVTSVDYADLKIYNLRRTNVPPGVTKRQTTRILEVGGTERTPGSIRVASSGAPTGYTFVHTSPEAGLGYSPPLRRWRVNGNTVTTDANLFSGAREPVNLTAIEAQVPLTSLPEGEYILAAVMRSNTAGTFPITWTANSLISGYGYLGDTVSGVAQAEFLDPGFWNLVPLDVVTLPPVRSADALATVQLTLNRAPVGSEVIDLDEWWAFRIGDDCALTIVNNPVSRLWLDSPDVNRAVPQVWIGDFNNRSDARHPGPRLIAQGGHVLHPDGTATFVASNGADYPEVSATYYKRWHSNAAE